VHGMSRTERTPTAYDARRYVAASTSPLTIVRLMMTCGARPIYLSSLSGKYEHVRNLRRLMC